MNFIFFSKITETLIPRLTVFTSGSFLLNPSLAILAKCEENQTADVAFDTLSQTYFLCLWSTKKEGLPTVQTKMTKGGEVAYRFAARDVARAIRLREGRTKARSTLSFIYAGPPITDKMLPHALLFPLLLEQDNEYQLANAMTPLPLLLKGLKRAAPNKEGSSMNGSKVGEDPLVQARDKERKQVEPSGLFPSFRAESELPLAERVYVTEEPINDDHPEIESISELKPLVDFAAKKTGRPLGSKNNQASKTAKKSAAI